MGVPRKIGFDWLNGLGEKLSLKSVDNKGQTAEEHHTISSPCARAITSNPNSNERSPESKHFYIVLK